MKMTIIILGLLIQNVLMARLFRAEMAEQIQETQNGDCQGENGYDDIAGQEMMNCTGFVWHALYKASGMDYQAAYDRIPHGGGVGAGNWRDFLEK